MGMTFALGALGAVPQIINMWQAEELNRQADERFDARIGPTMDAISGMQGLIDAGPSADEIRAITEGATPGQAAFDAFRRSNVDFSLPTFLQGMGAATQAGLQTLGTTSGQIANLFDRTSGAVGTALDEARALLQGGRAEDTLGLGQRIVELSGLNELQADPRLEFEQAGLAGRRQQALANQALGASADEGMRAALLGDIGTQANIRALAGQERAQAFNKALADTRANVLTSTGSLMEQINAGLLGQEAGTFGQQAALAAQMGGQQAGLQAGLGQSAANAQLATIAPLLQAMSTDATLGQRAAEIEAGLASQAELDDFAQIQFLLNSQAQQANILGQTGQLNLGVAAQAPVPAVVPWGNALQPFSQAYTNFFAQRAAQPDTGFLGLGF